MKTIKEPKFVKKANSWCVSVFETGDKGSKIQKINWFIDKKEADNYIK